LATDGSQLTSCGFGKRVVWLKLNGAKNEFEAFMSELQC
jgi:hypothetical protein